MPNMSKETAPRINHYKFNCQKCGADIEEYWSPLTLWPYHCQQMMSFRGPIGGYKIAEKRKGRQRQ